MTSDPISYEYTLDKDINAKYMMSSDTSWWHHQMETFSALLDLCAGNYPVTCEFPSKRPVSRSFDVFFDLRQKKKTFE